MGLTLILGVVVVIAMVLMYMGIKKGNKSLKITSSVLFIALFFTVLAIIYAVQNTM
tara:strand:- start:604 stop:771 length:168 start_codon:yes stop_codon:yes gene_type:complete